LADGLFSLLRISKDDKFNILSINNFTNKSICIQLPSFIKESAIELIKNETILTNSIKIEAYQTMWIRFKKEN